MIMIKIDTVGTTSLLTGLSTLDSTVENDEDATTTVLLTASTLSSSVPTVAVHAEATQRYIDSLSDTELIEMEQRLNEKENEMTLKVGEEELEIESPKTYKKI